MAGQAYLGLVKLGAEATSESISSPLRQFLSDFIAHLQNGSIVVFTCLFVYQHYIWYQELSFVYSTLLYHDLSRTLFLQLLKCSGILGSIQDELLRLEKQYTNCIQYF